MSFYLFLIWSKRGCVSKSALEMPKKGVLFLAKLYLFLCKIGMKISTNVLETAQKGVKFLKMYLKPCEKGVQF